MTLPFDERKLKLLPDEQQLASTRVIHLARIN